MANTVEQRRINAARQRDYQARKKLEKLAKQGSVPLVSASPPDPAVLPDDALNVTVNAPPPAAPLSLKERLFGSRGAVGTKKATSGKAKDVSLISSTLPTILASLIATYAHDIVKDPYKPCTPTKAEVTAILGPLFEIIARRVDVVTQASEDALDLAKSFLAGVAWGARAYIMYVQIKDKTDGKEQSSSRDQPAVAAPANGAYSDGYRANQSSHSGAGGPVSPGAAGSASNGGTAVSHAGVNGASPASDDLSDRDREAAAVADMFSRDKQGRIGLGLLPRPVQ